MDDMGAVEGNASIAPASQNSCDGDAQDNSIQDNAHSRVELIRRRFLLTGNRALVFQK